MKKLWDSIWSGEPVRALGILAAVVNAVVWLAWPGASGAVATALSLIVAEVGRSQVYSENTALKLIASPRKK